MRQDRQRIADVLTTLAFACDDRDWEEFGRLFTGRLHYDASRHSGSPAADLTVEEFTAIARGVLDGFDCTHHALSNTLIPSEPVVIAAGVYAASGETELLWVVLATAAGLQAPPDP